MNRFTVLLSALSLTAALAACASPSDTTETVAAVEAPQLIAVAEVQNAPLPMAIAPAAPSAPEDALVIPVSYACEGGRTFTATFPSHGEYVKIAAAGEVLTLAHREAADTVMFSDGRATLTAEGAEATLTGVDAPYTSCMAG